MYCCHESLCIAVMSRCMSLSWVYVAVMSHCVAVMSHCVAVMSHCVAVMRHCVAVMSHCIAVMSHCVAVMSHCMSQSEAFQRDLVIMERVVNLNTYQPKLASYRNFVIIEGTVFHVLCVKTKLPCLCTS